MRNATRNHPAHLVCLFVGCIGLAPARPHATTTATTIVETAAATSRNRSSAADERPDVAALTVSLVTIGPGAEVWQWFGHSALRVHDHRTGSDIAYDYGRFDFSEKDFETRFLRGWMRYSMGRTAAQELIATYRAEGRSLRVQELNLTAAEATALAQFLEWNARPENRSYRYDYYLDNCATRIRDALNRVLDDSLRRQLAAVPTNGTHRSETLRFTARSAIASIGLLLALGPSTDRRLTAWDAGFLPTELPEQLRHVTVAGPDGDRVPLIRSEHVLSQPEPISAVGGSAAPLRGYLLSTGVLAGSALAALGALAARTRTRTALLMFGLLGALWGLVAGTVGVVLIGLWTLTDHTASHWNANILQLSPFALALSVLVPAATVPASPWMKWAWRAAMLSVGVGVGGALAQALAGFHQSNEAVVALALPIHCGLAWGLWRLARASASASGEHLLDANQDECPIIGRWSVLKRDNLLEDAVGHPEQVV